MKTKEIQDLKVKSRGELLKMAADLKAEILRLKLDNSMKKVKNFNELRTKMKDRARLLTIAHMKGDK